MQLTSQGFKRVICSRVVKCQQKGLWEAEVGMDGVQGMEGMQPSVPGCRPWCIV